MPQYNVPQFVEMEDKIIGPFTLKQFAVLLAGGLIVLTFWALFELSLFFWVFSVPTGLLAFFIAIGNVNGRPILSHLLPLIVFVKQPRRLVFHRDASESVTKKELPKSIEEHEPSSAEVQSRLKRLAYILDQRVEEEEELETQNAKPKT